MTATLVIGSDESVLEGIAQVLGAAGQRCHVVRSLAEAAAVLSPALPVTVQRATLADLVLPWERQRLVTMVQRITERAVASGRTRPDTPPENRVV
jgi:hypothetical protein